MIDCWNSIRSEQNRRIQHKNRKCVPTQIEGLHCELNVPFHFVRNGKIQVQFTSFRIQLEWIVLDDIHQTAIWCRIAFAFDGVRYDIVQIRIGGLSIIELFFIYRRRHVITHLQSQQRFANQIRRCDSRTVVGIFKSWRIIVHVVHAHVDEQKCWWLRIRWIRLPISGYNANRVTVHWFTVQLLGESYFSCVWVQIE